MTEDNFYSKETIDAKLEAIHDTAKRIEIQVLKTNGRVTTLESKVEKQSDDFSKWRYIVTGGLVVAGLMGAPSAATLLKTLSGL